MKADGPFVEVPYPNWAGTIEQERRLHDYTPGRCWGEKGVRFETGPRYIYLRAGKERPFSYYHAIVLR